MGLIQSTWDDADFTRAGTGALREVAILYPEDTWATSPLDMYQTLESAMFEGSRRDGEPHQYLWAYLNDLCEYSEVRHDYSALAVALMGLVAQRLFMERAEARWNAWEHTSAP